MTTTKAPATHPAFPGFTGAFIEYDEGQPLTYIQYSGRVGPAVQFAGDQNTREPDPIDVPQRDAQLAADGYLRVGDWSWTADIWGCAVRQITVPAGTVIRDRYDRAHSAREAIAVLASGTATLTVAGRGQDGKTAADLKASLLPANPAFRRGARVALAGGVAYSPQDARIRIAVYQLATDIAEAANLITTWTIQ
jgi:hypothetical protein